MSVIRQAKLIGLKKVGAFKTEHTTRATRHAFATGQAMAVLDWLAQPGVAADINLDRTTVRADAALYTAGAIGYDVALP